MLVAGAKRTTSTVVLIYLIVHSAFILFLVAGGIAILILISKHIGAYAVIVALVFLVQLGEKIIASVCQSSFAARSKFIVIFKLC